eukprot:CAMPEP_0198120658 /NCGR_PEP_ID=MMETSP1442-20131203/29793_1 /TAXON_ID= /ORGANISM="Craspedostauros australis, Strain CCMP3328" /LENGTH=328 /DNA_ID=CAMNT_0043779333 /DNA_START=197 /DNA_END=1183 /DNA_ORIENTATION=-
MRLHDIVNSRADRNTERDDVVRKDLDDFHDSKGIRRLINIVREYLVTEVDIDSIIPDNRLPRNEVIDAANACLSEFTSGGGSFLIQRPGSEQWIDPGETLYHFIALQIVSLFLQYITDRNMITADAINTYEEINEMIPHMEMLAEAVDRGANAYTEPVPAYVCQISYHLKKYRVRMETINTRIELHYFVTGFLDENDRIVFDPSLIISQATHHGNKLTDYHDEVADFKERLRRDATNVRRFALIYAQELAEAVAFNRHRREHSPRMGAHQRRRVEDRELLRARMYATASAYARTRDADGLLSLSFARSTARSRSIRRARTRRRTERLQ